VHGGWAPFRQSIDIEETSLFRKGRAVEPADIVLPVGVDVAEAAGAEPQAGSDGSDEGSTAAGADADGTSDTPGSAGVGPFDIGKATKEDVGSSLGVGKTTEYVVSTSGVGKAAEDVELTSDVGTSLTSGQYTPRATATTFEYGAGVGWDSAVLYAGVAAVR
jgi:hypothetical protein